MDPAKLEALKKRLVEMRARLIGTVGDIESAIQQDVIAPGELTNVPFHPADLASEGVDRNVALAKNEEQILEQVEAALRRIEEGTYGKCEECGQEIAEDRLDALPYTAMCIQCARKNEEQNGTKAPRPDYPTEIG